MAHHLFPLSLALLVLACFKCHRPPKSSPTHLPNSHSPTTFYLRLSWSSSEVPPSHHPFGKMSFLFLQINIFSTLVMAMLSLPNINLGIPVWYIDPLANTPPDQLYPHVALTMIQLISTTTTSASFP